MKVVFMGTPDFAASSLRALLDGGFDVAGVFTQPDKPVGRRHTLQKPPVKVLAEERGIPVYQPANMRDGQALGILRRLSPDVIAVVAYGRILPREILDVPPLGCVNIHGSLLPRYRGAAPIQWAVANGEKETGVTAMYLSEKMDAGDILDTRRVQILPEETAGELFERLAPLGGELLCDTLRAIGEGRVARTPQNEEEATYAPPLTRELAVLDFTMDGGAIVSRIRGFDPWPVATAELAGVNFKIYKARAERGAVFAAPGTVLSADKEGIRVACGDGAVLITQLQAPGGKRMQAADYLRGHPLCL